MCQQLNGSVGWVYLRGRCAFSKLELELIQAHMTQKPVPVLREEEGARALRNQTGGGGGVQRPVGALAQVFVSGPQNRKRS